MEELEKNINKRKIYISLLVSVICIISVSYAFFVLYLRQTDNNAVTALSCFTSTLTEENSAISLSNEFPISDENGMKKTPFTFKITNNCNNYVKAYITIDPLKEGTANYILSKYMKANVSTKGSTDGTSLIIGTQNTKVLDNKHNGYIIKEVGLKSKESKEFDLRLWIDYDTTKEQAAGMTYLSQVVIITEPGKQTLGEAILANNEVKTPITTPGSEVSAHILNDIISQSESIGTTYQKEYVTYGSGWEANGTNFNLTGAAVTSDTYANSYSSLVGKYLPAENGPAYSFFHAFSSNSGSLDTTTNLEAIYYVVSATSNSITYKLITSNKNVSEALLASTEDDYGTSYYFRGAVKNNYVEFANKCWRIIRVVGDGSVKLTLHNDNINNTKNPCSSSNNSTTGAFAHFSGSTYKSAFNTNNNDNAYVGFMYGTVGASSYAATHANTNKSKILTNLETWYTNNLASYADKLADTIWCNDKSTVSGSLGYGTNTTTYASRNRLFSVKQPTLKCPNDNDGGKLSKFTVNDTINGNGNLTYKIGLLTADELVFAGYKRWGVNNSVYIYENANEKNSYWWTLTPDCYNGYAANLLMRDGILYNDIDPVDIVIGLRPAISLIASTTITSGTGTSEDPYIIE